MGFGEKSKIENSKGSKGRMYLESVAHHAAHISRHPRLPRIVVGGGFFGTGRMVLFFLVLFLRGVCLGIWGLVLQKRTFSFENVVTQWAYSATLWHCEVCGLALLWKGFNRKIQI